MMIMIQFMRVAAFTSAIVALTPSARGDSFCDRTVRQTPPRLIVEPVVRYPAGQVTMLGEGGGGGFGGGDFEGASPRRRSRRQQQVPGDDVRSDLEIPFETAVLGGKVSLRWITNSGPPAPNPCGPRGAHGFFVQDGAAVSAIIGFIRAR